MKTIVKATTSNETFLNKYDLNKLITFDSGKVLEFNCLADDIVQTYRFLMVDLPHGAKVTLMSLDTLLLYSMNMVNIATNLNLPNTVISVFEYTDTSITIGNPKKIL